jgi:putative tryptophan/tyrosine transport system substrate-binding protein
VRRREFVALAGCAVACIPTALVAQSDRKIWRIGWLHPASLAVRAVRTQLEAFREGMGEFGYVEGHNVAIEFRWAEGDADRLPEFAAELVRSGVDVIVAANIITVLAARQATRAIPIVMVAGADPVGHGVAASLARPGGNVTGLSNQNEDLDGKRLEILLDLAHGAKRIGVMVDPLDPLHGQTLTHMSAAATTRGIEIVPIQVTGPAGLMEAFGVVQRSSATAVAVQLSPRFLNVIGQLVSLANDARLPAIYGTRTYVEAGGLIGYGFDSSANFRRSASYVDRILKGSNPADLPIEQPTKFELVINLKTAKALRLTIPPALLARADEVIE